MLLFPAALLNSADSYTGYQNVVFEEAKGRFKNEVCARVALVSRPLIKAVATLYLTQLVIGRKFHSTFQALVPKVSLAG